MAMTKQTLNNTIFSLAIRCIEHKLWHPAGTPMVTRPEWTISDGRSRKVIWRDLVKQGYIMPIDHGEESLTVEGTVTSKAFDEISASEFHLPPAGGKPDDPAGIAELYKPDVHRKYAVCVSWDVIPTAQKVAVLEHADKYTFTAVSDLSGNWEPKKTEFKLGGAKEAMATLGSAAYGQVVVTCKTIEDRFKAASRESLLEQNRPTAINSYLVSKKYLGEDETLPVKDKNTMLGGHGLPSNPQEWTAETVHAVILGIDSQIIRLGQKLHALNRLCQAAADAGGWDALVADYEKELGEAVDQAINGGSVEKPS